MQQQQPFLSSCLHDQLQCVSISGMASACGISRPAAARELQIFYDNAMQDDSTKKTYRVTCCRTSVETIHGFDTTIRAVAESDEHDEITTAVDVTVPESIPSTVFSLMAKSVSTRTSKDDDVDTRKGANVKHQSGDGAAVETCIYALALVQPDHDGYGNAGTTESLLTAHERYLAQQRDQLVTKTFMDHSLNDEEAFIVPSNEVDRQLETLPPPTLRWWEANESNNSIGSSRLAQLPNKKREAAMVPTTAASFFASNKATSKKVSEDEKENTAAKKVEMMAASKTSSSQNKQHGSNRPTAVSKPAAAAVASSSSNKALTLSSQSSTGSGTLSTNPSKGVGNADDFVGDMEEDEDEDESVPDSKTASPMNVDEDDDTLPDVAKQRPARKAATKQPKPQRAILDDDEVMVMDQEEHPRRQPAKKPRSKLVASVDAGAMDAYTTQRRTVPSQSSATATASSTGPQQRRRQKQWVEKTTLDANGYLRTESQEVWVDVPSDDESPAAPAATPAALVPKPPTKKAVSGKTKKPAMKQGNLMGFFQKK
jgi:DNA polymerase subunit Cdc27